MSGECKRERKRKLNHQFTPCSKCSDRTYQMSSSLSESKRVVKYSFEFAIPYNGPGLHLGSYWIFVQTNVTLNEFVIAYCVNPALLCLFDPHHCITTEKVCCCCSKCSDRAYQMSSRHGSQSDANDSSLELTGSWWGCYLHSSVPSLAAVYATLQQQSA